MTKEFDFKHIGKDFSAGLVVFLVALPLCLGISLASDAPLFSGIIAGIIGGIVVGLISGSKLGVSGPAAGLAVIVANAIAGFPSYEVFLASVVLGGALQLVLGLVGAGKIAFYFPSSVIKGMLAAIGLTIILKQIPHAFGIDRDPEGEFQFLQPDGENTFSELLNLQYFTEGALIIGVVCMLVLILWDRKWVKQNPILSLIPGPLLAVVLGVVINMFYPENLRLAGTHLVQIPISGSFAGFVDLFRYPDFSSITSFAVIKTGFLIAIIASLETLLCVEATDRLDPRKNITPTNRELIAQGAGNMLSGLIGGIPVTQVIVRSSANIQAGGRTKLAAVIHGFLLLFCVVLIPDLLNMIPLSALAAVLIIVGYKLAKPETFKRMWAEGQDQFIPFIATIIAVLFTDLLVGILIGLLIGIGYVLYTNFRSAINLHDEGNHVIVDFKKDVFFYNRAELMKIFSKLEEGDELTLDGRNVDFMDHDIFLAIEDFVKDSKKKNIKVNVLDITRKKIKFGKTDETIKLDH
ncbi:SulP family inorganic anion transporter [Jiulongibacter sediminis]|uniref:Membrane protein n=1 Tax=Jiulongibacter sediminis TaxID=1605367 RepID=A0A0P7BZX4_9BACT|nr:SulP family inorganic anion transporter [Jiulongibacter sediminis]KPM49944.1 membrane protein [Jiulongibacter sediminis]